MGEYDLICVGGGHVVEDGATLSCDAGHKSLLRARYSERRLELLDCESMFKFYNWLPVDSTLESDTCPTVFRNEGLSKELGLEDLWIGFTGYHPDRGAYASSGTFKELEALPTCARMRDSGRDTILLASAGNTARAFAQTVEGAGLNAIIVVPSTSSERLKVKEDTGRVKLISVNGDYTDAIRISDRISDMGDFVIEGGAKNIARRDGMGTVMLEGAVTMKSLPDYYFQGVGSGTGAISAWEASMRLIDDGRFGNRLPRLHLAQNIPFSPMAKAWREGRRDISDDDLPEGKDYVNEVYADVLTNRTPPYGVAGGVYDAMTACGGAIYEIDNREASAAEKLWMSYEGVKPDPAASVAFASLIKAVEEGDIDTSGKVFLNMTGGGLERAVKELGMESVKTFASVDVGVSDDELEAIIDE